jgi:hypothetical protein
MSYSTRCLVLWACVAYHFSAEQLLLLHLAATGVAEIAEFTILKGCSLTFVWLIDELLTINIPSSNRKSLVFKSLRNV